MALSHIQNSRAGRENHEAYTINFYRATLIPPRGVANDPVITEAIMSVTGFKYPGPESIQQQFQISRRNFASGDVDNTQSIAITFSLNLNDAYELYLLNLIQDWRKAVYDPLTGAHGLKKDYVGKLILENHARNGQIFWTRTLHNIWPSGELSGGAFDLDYTSADPQTLETNWVADWFTEERI
jgi:hypothetical protein